MKFGIFLYFGVIGTETYFLTHLVEKAKKKVFKYKMLFSEMCVFVTFSMCISRTGIRWTKTCPPYTSIAYTKNGGGPYTSFGIGYTKTGIR